MIRSFIRYFNFSEAPRRLCLIFTSRLVGYITILIAILLLFSLAACANNETTQKDDQTTTIESIDTNPVTSQTTTGMTETGAVSETTTTITASTTTVETTPLNLVARNFMTGEVLLDPLAEIQRPMAFMINNTKIGTPQIGTSDADLIFETEIEGGVTRMLAVYTDVGKVPELGSLRSLRHNFIDIAGGLDAIVVHVGSSYVARDQLEQQGADHINLQNYPSAWWRDEIWWKERGKEHSVKTTSERMTVALERSGLRTILSDKQTLFCDFHDPDELIPANGESASLVTIPFSGYNKTTLTWEEAAGVYSKGEYGKPQLDVATGQPLRFSNALILLTSITEYESGSILREIDLSEGVGFYISGGRAESIQWAKGTTNDPFRFTTQSKEPLVMNVGKTYIAIVSNRRTISFQP